MARFDFNPEDYKDEVNNFQPVPRGEYKLKCVEAEEFDTKDNTGTYIKAKFEIVDGPYENRKIFQNFNINNKSDKAQAIGRGQIYAWSVACGKPNADDTDQLLECVFVGLVDIEEGKAGYSDQNRIKRFIDPNEAITRGQAAGAYQEPKSAGANGSSSASSQEPPARREPPRRPAKPEGDKKPWDDDIPF